MTAATAAPFAHGYAHPVEKPVQRRPRFYGPHDESRVPRTITVPCAGRYPICGGENHPKFGRHDVTLQLHPAVGRQIAALNTLAHERGLAAHLEELDGMYDNHKRAGTEDDPKLYRTGHCDPGSPDSGHRGCKDRYVQRRTIRDNKQVRTVVELFLCICDKPCCSGHELQQRRLATLQQEVRDSGAILCGPEPTMDDLQAVADFGAYLRGELTTSDMVQRGFLPAHREATLVTHHDTQTSGGTAVAVEVHHPTTAWRADEVADLMVELEACPLCDGAWPDHVFTDDDRVVCA